MRDKSLCGLILALLPAGASAQLPQYFVTPAARPGGTIQTALVGQPGHVFASYVDVSGGPVLFLGEKIYLGLGGATTLLDAGTFGLGGLRYLALKAPSSGVPVGMVFYLQYLVVDSNAPNGSFRVSNGESTVLFNSTAVISDEFTDPPLQGFSGNYDRTVRHRLQAAPVRRRLHTFKPRVGVPFTLPIMGPLNPDGARVQMVFRNTDLGATGEREVLAQVRWLPRGTVLKSTFKRLVIEAAHTLIVPDFTIDPWTAFPKYPNSGLSLTFAQNQRPGEQPVKIYDGSYVVRPQDVRPDGYMSYPTPQKGFVYNGRNSLLLDFKMTATLGLNTTTGQQIQLMVSSSPRPNARAYAAGKAGRVVDPHAVTKGDMGDNSMVYMQFEFVQTDSLAVSPWHKAPAANPDYHKPYLAQSLPKGTAIKIEYRGAQGPGGAGATIWLPLIDSVDRFPYLQYRVTLKANPWTGDVPSLESIVIPIN